MNRGGEQRGEVQTRSDLQQLGDEIIISWKYGKGRSESREVMQSSQLRTTSSSPFTGQALLGTNTGALCFPSSILGMSQRGSPITNFIAGDVAREEEVQILLSLYLELLLLALPVCS